MRKHLTIGELSKMLEISAHSIRYYEKEGLIQPTKISDSGYRLYDYSDIYTLSSIMLMRDSQIPLKDIKKLLANGDKDEYHTVLKKSYNSIEKQIEKLMHVKNQLHENLEFIQNMDSTNCTFEYKDYPQRKLKVIKQSCYDMNYSVKELYDEFSQHHIDMSRLYKSDVVYFLSNKQVHYCIEDNDEKYGSDGICFKPGTYLCYKKYDGLINQTVHEFYSYMKSNQIQYEGDLIIYIRVGVSFFSQSGYPTELQIKVK